MLKVYTDAATNLEKSGGGILIISEEQQQQLSIPIAENNNHQAELAVILYALRYLIDHKLNDHTVLLYSDSKTAIKILDQGQTKNKLFQPYLSEFNELASQFPLLVLQWIPEAKNKGADNLARQCLRKNL
ncbi:ribonuclease HI family protein [Candidatus Enterococcus murrayae]|uniref:Ribonuclease HI family protein n=1 Tax=Candidatus Enterococcus murrayae TaxID=2815321 RepID=A0ABS3HCB4_9ENTE|nr:ribonuclease HI family protein [Enterococcus sp. MJM16]MBO0450677.1 ribonuclease HI family protein [Enterococcus sp. MJM16]